MPVDTPHPEYLTHSEDWQLIRDLLAGERQVKSRGTKYLPKTFKMEDVDYQGYLMRASLYGATARTHEAMTGLITRKPPEMADMPVLEDFMQDADMRGTTWVKYVQDIVTNVGATGRGGTMVDWDNDEDRAYCAFYPETEILNWRISRDMGRSILTLLVLREAIEDPSNTDEFAPVLRFKYRVWRVVDGVASVQIYIEKAREKQVAGNKPPTAEGTGNAEDSGFDIEAEIFPAKKGVPLSFIPFVWHSSNAPGEGISKPPLLDVAVINISHFRTTADLENGRYVAATPTPYACGFDIPEGEQLVMGARVAWTTPNVNAKVGFLEFSGAGLQSLKEGLEQKEAQMAAIGAKLIEPKTGDAEAFETVAMRGAAESSALARLGQMLTESLSEVLRLVAWWEGTGETPIENSKDFWIVLNKDFVSSRLKPDELTALSAAWQAGTISYPVLFHCLQRGEMLPDEWDLEKERAALEETPPPMVAMALTAQQQDASRLEHQTEMDKERLAIEKKGATKKPPAK